VPAQLAVQLAEERRQRVDRLLRHFGDDQKADVSRRRTLLLLDAGDAAARSG
jgi:hypothetical protein